MGIEIITVEAAGGRWTAWRDASIRAALKEAARSFRLTIAAELGASATNGLFRAGTPVTIRSNADLLVTGYVDQKQPRFAKGESSDASIVISGRSKAADIIDSSAIHPTGEIENKTLLDIARELDKAGVGFSTDQQLPVIPRFRLTPGESVFSALERVARDQGLALMGEPDGSVRITKAATQRHAGGLFEGRNIKAGEADHNWSNRHSEYRVKGQRPFGSGADALEIEAIARDAGVNRYRPIIIVQDQDTDADRAKARAQNRRDRAAGNSLRCSITTQGFRDDAGTIWTPNRLVWIESDFLDVRQDMLIEGVTFSMSSQGSEAKLDLVDPRAYGGKKGKGNKSGGEWDIGNSPAEVPAQNGGP